MDQEAERLLTRLLSGLEPVLGLDLVGLYLFGSLATGDFEPGVSDVDTVAVLREDPTDAQLKALRQLHREIDEEMLPWRERVEVVYLSTQALASFRTGSSSAARISPGEPFHVIRVDHRCLIDWYQLREVGRALYGPPATTLVPTITNTEYVEAVRRHILDWPDPEADEFLASYAYTIITLCRGLRTIRTGEHVSKRDAADWGCEAMPDHATNPRCSGLARTRSLPTAGRRSTVQGSHNAVVKDVQCSLRSRPTTAC
jgi:predicted nucleotidyltransferase